MIFYVQIFQLARVQYGRIDYSTIGDRIQVWEINTNPECLSGNQQAKFRAATSLGSVVKIAEECGYFFTIDDLQAAFEEEEAYELIDRLQGTSLTVTTVGAVSAEPIGATIQGNCTPE
jgi:hypothetical protein